MSSDHNLPSCWQLDDAALLNDEELRKAKRIVAERYTNSIIFFESEIPVFPRSYSISIITTTTTTTSPPFLDITFSHFG